MKIMVENVGLVQIDECDLPIVLSTKWKLKNGYAYGESGEYEGQYMHIVIAKKAGII